MTDTESRDGRGWVEEPSSCPTDQGHKKVFRIRHWPALAKALEPSQADQRVFYTMHTSMETNVYITHTYA